jgi:hypothetical protein
MSISSFFKQLFGPDSSDANELFGKSETCRASSNAVAEKLRRAGVQVSEKIIVPLPPYSEETAEDPKAD